MWLVVLWYITRWSARLQSHSALQLYLVNDQQYGATVTIAGHCKSRCSLLGSAHVHGKTHILFHNIATLSTDRLCCSVASACQYAVTILAPLQFVDRGYSVGGDWWTDDRAHFEKDQDLIRAPRRVSASEMMWMSRAGAPLCHCLFRCECDYNLHRLTERDRLAHFSGNEILKNGLLRGKSGPPTRSMSSLWMKYLLNKQWLRVDRWNTYLATSNAKSDVIFLLGDPDFL